MVGYINRANVMGSWRGHLHEESVREHGWFEKFNMATSEKAALGALSSAEFGPSRTKSDATWMAKLHSSGALPRSLR
jgi:hypothetical protein